MEEEKKENVQKEDELNTKIKSQIDRMITNIFNEDLNVGSIDLLQKLSDIRKNIANEEYWKIKEESIMRYKGYGDYEDYAENSYGRRGVPGTGRRRYSDGSYGRRGVPGTGRGRYRGEDMLEEMMYQYGNYSDGKEMYGDDQDTLKSFKYMLKAFKDYYKHLKQEASSQEEVQLLEETAREMIDM